MQTFEEHGILLRCALQTSHHADCVDSIDHTMKLSHHCGFVLSCTLARIFHVWHMVALPCLVCFHVCENVKVVCQHETRVDSCSRTTMPRLKTCLKVVQSGHVYSPVNPHERDQMSQCVSFGRAEPLRIVVKPLCHSLVLVPPSVPVRKCSQTNCSCLQT